MRCRRVVHRISLYFSFTHSLAFIRRRCSLATLRSTGQSSVAFAISKKMQLSILSVLPLRPHSAAHVMTPPPSTSPQRIPIAYPVGSPSNSIFTSGSSAPRNYQARDRRKPLQLFSETVCCCCGTTLKVERGAEVVRCSVEGCEVVLDLREGVEGQSRCVGREVVAQTLCVEKGVGTAVDDDLDSTIRATFKDVASLNRSLRSEEDDVYSIEPIIDFRLRTMNNVDTLRSSITTFLSRPGFMPAGLDTTWVLLILLEVCRPSSTRRMSLIISCIVLSDPRSVARFEGYCTTSPI